MRYNIGDILIFKKNHACGGNKWLVLKLGVSPKLECLECKRQITLLPSEIDKRVKK